MQDTEEHRANAGRDGECGIMCLVSYVIMFKSKHYANVAKKDKLPKKHLTANFKVLSTVKKLRENILKSFGLWSYQEAEKIQ